MKESKNLVLIFVLACSVLFSQDKGLLNEKQGNSFIENMLSAGETADYKIISSNSSYIEIEFYPSNITGEKINYKGETFDSYNFEGGVPYNTKSAGEPDLKYRAFNIALPSDFNNSVQVLDFDVKNLSNVNLAPVPFINYLDPYNASFENITYSYIKGSKFAENKFFPENISSLGGTGNVRELTTAVLKVYPFQYNPLSRIMKVYTRVRVRVSFGSKPLPFSRPRSRQEIDLLKGVALNSDLALNWLNPKFKDIMRDNVLVPSVLAAGDWYKIEIKDNSDDGKSEGIYKISKGFLDTAGINVNNIDPRTIKMYGNGGDILALKHEALRPGDLQQMNIFIEGENDGVFNAQDYILFYASSINKWQYDTANNSFQHFVNYYSRSNYYWMCINTPGNGIRINQVPSSSSPPQLTPASFTEKIFNEPEVTNLLNEGNLWLSSRKNPGGSFEWNTTLTGLENGSNILYKIKPASRCMLQYENHMLIKDDYSSMAEIYYPMGTVSPGFGNWIWTDMTSFTINQSQKTNGEQVKFRGTYSANTSAAEGYMDWWEIHYKRRYNSAVNDALGFYSPELPSTAAGLTTVEYNISSFSSNNVKVFDVTEHNNVKFIQPISSAANNVKFRKDELSGIPSRFFVNGPNGYKRPTSISGRIANQNLRGITDGASFVIITDKELLSAANRLKTKREGSGPNDPNYLKTLVVSTELLYNEFSGGVLDVTAFRDFLKYAYNNWSVKPVYVLMLGDGHFNYKNLGGSNPVNPVPAFEITHPQMNQVDGFTSDDYFVSVSGGNMMPIGPVAEPPDIAIGRIPAINVQEVNDYLDKVDIYEGGQSNGIWKNRMVFVADDQVTSDGCEGVFHLAQIEDLGENHTPPTIDKRKIYIVTYPTVITPAGRRKPQVNSDIIKYWNEGALNIHYTGHGSPDVWAHEYILERGNIMSQLHNDMQYPFISIASCDMSKFDNPNSQSAGEEFMIKPKKGAIGTLAATRPVYADGNAILMRQFFNDLYNGRDTLLLPRRFGKALFNTKQIYCDVNSIKYILMCDPTLRTQLPRYRSRIDSISGLSNDTMRALSRIRLYGSILKADSSVWNNYNGQTPVKVFDVDRQINLLDECGFTHIFRLNGGVIYSGNQKIINGHWTADFIVPKDISYREQNGKIVNYFYNTQADGAGIYTNFFVGGIDPNAPVDTVGPNISLFLNDRNFRSGDIVNRNFKLIADLSDESGINTTGTVGHKIEGILDGNENIKYDFTNFYNGDTTYKSGTLEYDFSNIETGNHRLRMKGWDTYNNSSEVEINFAVSDGLALNVVNVYNYPNPFKDNTTFTFQHNFPNTIDIKIKIYTVAGRLIKEISQNQVNDKFVSIFWSGKDEDGESLGNGVYIYKLVVETGEGQSVTNIGKLAVLK